MRANETATHHAVTRVPMGEASETVGSVLARLPGSQLDSAAVVYVQDGEGRMMGAARLEAVLAAPAGQPLGQLADPLWPRVAPEQDQEHVASEALAHGAISVALVDPAGKLVGAVAPEALLAILRHEHVEDLHRLVGVQREQAHTRRALEEPPARRARHRLPWLLVGLAGSLLAAGVMSRFERVLESRLAVAFFVPAIVYLADAIGTQTEAIVVRGLSLSRLPLRRLLAGELGTGLLIGSALGAAALAPVALLFGDWALAAAVSLAILIAGAVATSIGLLLPWLLQRIGSDPALGSGPVATIIQDVLSLLIYFAIAILVLG